MHINDCAIEIGRNIVSLLLSMESFFRQSQQQENSIWDISRSVFDFNPIFLLFKHSK